MSAGGSHGNDTGNDDDYPIRLPGAPAPLPGAVARMRRNDDLRTLRGRLLEIQSTLHLISVADDDAIEAGSLIEVVGMLGDRVEDAQQALNSLASGYDEANHTDGVKNAAAEAPNHVFELTSSPHWRRLVEIPSMLKVLRQSIGDEDNVEVEPQVTQLVVIERLLDEAMEGLEHEDMKSRN